MMVWGVTPDGTKIPLDPRSPVYRLTGVFHGDTAEVRRDASALVTHFATCSQASKFSKRGRTELGAAIEKSLDIKVTTDPGNLTDEMIKDMRDRR